MEYRKIARASIVCAGNFRLSAGNGIGASGKSARREKSRSSSGMTITHGAHNKARIIAVVGATGTGKGRYIKTELLPQIAAQVVVWSALERSDNYAGILRVPATESLADMIAAWRAGKSAVYEI